MSDSSPVRVVGDRIAHVVRLLDRLDGAARPEAAWGADHQIGELLAHLCSVIAEQREALATRLAALDRGEGAETTDAASDGATGARQGGPPSAVLERISSALTQVMAAQVRLYTTARLMADASTCELTAGHLRVCAEAQKVITWLLPDAVGQELADQEGLGCQCRCPACSVGVCLCVRNSTDTALHAWLGLAPFRTRGLPATDDVNTLLDRWSLTRLGAGRGVALAGDPRPGTPLAATGLRRGDRILEIEGVTVDANADVQEAITGREPGTELRLTVQRAAGAVSDLVVPLP